MKNRNSFISLLSALAALVITGCTERPHGAPRQPVLVVSDTADSRPPLPLLAPGAAGSPAFRRVPGMDCLVNEHGIRRKVIVSQRNVRARATPGGPETGPELLYFRPYYVFAVRPETCMIEYVHVGLTPRRDSILGWIPASAATFWDHRIAVRYRRDANRRLPPLTIYRDKSAVVELALTGNTTADPLARAAYAGADTPVYMPWPVVDVDRIEVNGGIVEILQLAFLAEHRVGGSLTEAWQPDAEQYSVEEFHRITKNVRTLDVIFVMDTTRSTDPHIEAMKQTVINLSEGLGALEFRPDLALGLTQFRDYVPGLMFRVNGRDSVTASIPLQADLPAFTRAVRPIRAATVCSRDWPEAVYDGVWDALTQPSWRGDKLSTRILILIGDNSANPPGSPGNPRGITPDQITARARAEGVTIFSVAVEGGGDARERKLHRAQFETLARGTGGQCFSLEASVADRLVVTIEAILKTETATVGTRAMVVEALREGKSNEQIMAERSMDIRQFTEIMEFLDRGGLDGDRLRGVPTFATGWALGEFRGVPLINKEIYCARSELDMLLAELNLLALHLSPEFSQGLAVAALGGRIHPGSFFARREPGPMDLHLMKQGIPVTRGILSLTRQQIEHMPEEERARRRENLVRTYIPRLLNARNSDHFIYSDDLEFGFVDEDLLP
jgi:hypothetical protein